MSEQRYTALFNEMHPKFFEREDIRNIPENVVCEEMLLRLSEFDENICKKEFADDITFGYYTGERAALIEAVEKVEPEWVKFYNDMKKVYCGCDGGKIASFCMIEDLGTHPIDGTPYRIGGPGCVGTVPEYRRRGIGLSMVKNATLILKEKGFDLSYIHYTGVAPWYGKLGYKTILKWNSKGII